MNSNTRGQGQSQGQGLEAGDLSRMAVRHFEIRYRRTKNGAYALLAFRAVRKLRLPVPGWVLEYLDGSVDRILASGGTKSPKAIAAGFELQTVGGGGSAQARLKNELRHSAILQDVRIAHYQKPRRNLELIFAEVGERYGRTTETVRDLYYQNQTSEELLK